MAQESEKFERADTHSDPEGEKGKEKETLIQERIDKILQIESETEIEIEKVKRSLVEEGLVETYKHVETRLSFDRPRFYNYEDIMKGRKGKEE